MNAALGSSPALRYAGVGTASIPPNPAPHDTQFQGSRHRQQFPTPPSPGYPQQHSYADEVKETHHVSPVYDQPYLQAPQPNGTTYHHRPRSPSMFHPDNHTPLSNFLSGMASTAKIALNSPSSLLKFNSVPSLTRKPSISNLSASQPAPSKLSTSPQSDIGFILLCGLWYMSSAMSSNTGKTILTRFRYPVTLTFAQFAFVAGYSVLLLALREQSGFNHVAVPAHPVRTGARRDSLSTTAGWGIRKPTRAHFQGTFIMSLFQIAGHVFSSMAIARVPVSTVHTIKALSPLFTVLSYAVLFKVRYGSATYLALLPLTLGVMLACSFDLRANAVGFLCALGSTVIFVSQNIFSKKLLPKDSPAAAAHGATGTTTAATSSNLTGQKLDKLNLLFYSSGMAFFLMIPIWFYSDARDLFNSFMDPVHSPVAHSANAPPPGTTASLLISFILNGTVHFAQNLLAFAILARTSPVTYSIASLIKRIAVICLAIVWSGQKVSLVQATGMTMTFIGLWMYNRAKSDVDKGERKRGLVEKRQEMFLPTTKEDARVFDVLAQQGGGGSLTPDVMTQINNQQQSFVPTEAHFNQNIFNHSAQPPPPKGPAVHNELSQSARIRMSLADTTAPAPHTTANTAGPPRSASVASPQTLAIRAGRGERFI